MCPVCNRAFTIHKIQIERGQGTYCSRSCALKGHPRRKRLRISFVCYQCGEKFERRPSEVEKAATDKRFCSLKCWYEYNQRENHYLWRGGQDERVNPEYRKWRQAVLERDKYFCRICYRRYDDLEAHHILPFGKYPLFRWVIRNGLTLCHDCHRMYNQCEEDYIRLFQFIAQLPMEIWKIEVTPQGYTLAFD